MKIINENAMLRRDVESELTKIEATVKVASAGDVRERLRALGDLLLKLMEENAHLSVSWKPAVFFLSALRSCAAPSSTGAWS